MMASSSGSDPTCSARRRLDGGKHRVQERNLTSDVWERLPEVLVEGILGKLPFSSLVHLCTVCKRWRGLILSSKKFPRCISRRNRLLFVTSSGRNPPREKLTVFGSSRGNWETASLHFIPQQFVLKEVVASSAGLLCFNTLVAEELIVCNPLTKCYRKLQMPSMPPSNSNRSCPWLAGMVVNLDNGHFKLMVAGFYPGSGGTTRVYDSLADSWKEVGSIPGFRHMWYLGESVQATECGKSLYFNVLHEFPYNLLKYDVEYEAWSWIRPPPEINRLSQNVVEHNGKILLVMPNLACWDTIPTLLHAFQLHEGQTTWETTWLRASCLPLSEEPEAMFDLGGIECVGRGDGVFFTRRQVRWPNPGHPEETTVSEWFHNDETNSVVISKWKTYKGDEELKSWGQIFTPSTLLL